LGTAFGEITSNIVLLGDHKQLGPVIKSYIAARLGLGEFTDKDESVIGSVNIIISFSEESLMERIMSKRRYQMNPLDQTYDKNYVTQLLDNFRSHPAILQFSNVFFYDSKLRAKIQEPERSFGTPWSHLKNKKFPVLFHCVNTPNHIIRGETSSFNNGEIDVVRSYVNLLLQDGIGGKKVEQEDIGIVSPYKAQLKKMRENLLDLEKVEIGTAEYYQGREKKIIIISTVKSRGNVGFLTNEKRLNVCITRAKSLLILVGNADTLQVNFFLMDYCAILNLYFYVNSSKIRSGKASYTSARQTMDAVENRLHCKV
jgi:superfamily I DNA and/or RNA helicase